MAGEHTLAETKLKVMPLLHATTNEPSKNQLSTPYSFYDMAYKILNFKVTRQGQRSNQGTMMVHTYTPIPTNVPTTCQHTTPYRFRDIVQTRLLKKIASEMPVPHSLGKYFQHHEIQKYCTSTNFRILSEHCQLYKGPNNV